VSARPQLYLIVNGGKRMPPACAHAWKQEVAERVKAHLEKPSRVQQAVNCVGLAGAGALVAWAVWVIWQALVIAWVVL
jgi:hypothetical protein